MTPKHSPLIAAAIATATLSTLAIAPIATAATLITNPAGQVTHIEDLRTLGHGTYNVTFVSGSYDDIFDNSLAPGTLGADGRMGPTFFDNQTGATAAAGAILIALGRRTGIAESSTRRTSDAFLIPFAEDNEEGNVLSAADTADSTGRESFRVLSRPSSLVIGSASTSTPATLFSWAKFTIPGNDNGDDTRVPEPTALLGLGIALGLSTLARRRNRNQ